MTTTSTLLSRKIKIEQKLKERGVPGYQIKYLPYLESDESTFASAYEVGARMIILYSCAYIAYEPNDSEKIMQWLQRENLWSHVSPEERDLFSGKIKNEEKLQDFTWRLESSYALCWALNLIDTLHPPTAELSQEQIAVFQSKLPKFGDKLESYLKNLVLRDKGEIFEENILNELATTFFRDLLFNRKEDTSDIHRSVSFERHKVLNWVRRFNDISEWDETDTST